MKKITVEHLTRIEGHGNIVIRVQGGKLEEARWDIVETPRYFEVMLKGKHATTAPLLAARICGICSISHCLTGLRATETALGVEIPGAASRLRLLAKHAETLQSHVLHLFFLAAPDFLGAASAIELRASHPEVVGLAVRLKGLANRMCDTIAGRTTHPVALQVGGVSLWPERQVLAGYRGELVAALDDLEAAVQLVRTFDLPDFVRETEFVSLKGETEYPFIGGRLISSDGVDRAEDEYLAMTNEYLDPNNTSKWSKLSRDAYAVGALARLNNNFDLLHPEARRVAALFGLEPVCHNPFMCNVAQLVETVHCAHESVRLIDELMAIEQRPELKTEAPDRAGSGVGAVEAPRGILFHDYDFDEQGRITRANCVVPTTQNNGNIHRDLPRLVAQLVDQGASDDELERLCSMLVRAYDPCVSCSVH